MSAPFDLDRLAPDERQLWNRYCAGPSDDSDLIRVHSFAHICMLETGVPEVVSEWLAEQDPENLVGQYHENVRRARESGELKAKKYRLNRLRIRLARRARAVSDWLYWYRVVFAEWRAKWTREAVAAKLRGWARQAPGAAFAGLKWSLRQVGYVAMMVVAIPVGTLIVLAMGQWAMLTFWRDTGLPK